MSRYEALFVLERLGNDSWDRVNWFVQFSQKALDRISKGDLLRIQEELAVLAAEAHIGGLPLGDVPLALPGGSEILQLQGTIRGLLDRWVDQGTLSLGPFSLTLELRRPRDDSDQLRAFRGYLDRAKPIPGQSMGEYVAEYNLSNKADTLLFYLSGLLRDHAGGIIRCPECQTIFLKLRRHARFCSRKCHSVAGMRVKREEKRQLKQQASHHSKLKRRSSADGKKRGS